MEKMCLLVRTIQASLSHMASLLPISMMSGEFLQSDTGG